MRGHDTARRGELKATVSVRPLDIVVAVWVVFWIWAAFSVHDSTQGIAESTGRVQQIGGAVAEAGEAITRLGDLPLIGGDVADIGRTVVEQGREAADVAASGRDSGRRLAVWLGLAVGLIPTVPLLMLHVPRRLRQERECRAVEPLLDHPQVEALLARRAAMNLPLDVVLATMGDPDAQGTLARAELRRLGLDRRLDA